ncbi:hypothetical protein TCAL_03348 [Tigriopus californicus]|uniref:Sarcalumenin n=1 Tax=Tigriopus californicus TaxID=6832 RepID=A0A553P7H8_TIGCA|nr:uncharacterized protein LOC131878554 [Tigriopus californicus]TRY73635.1 hypothetical protein TCAL_03348 [Tigriopus californicus]
MAATSTKTAARSGPPPWHSTWRRGVGIIIGGLVILVCLPNANAATLKTDCKHLGLGACRGQGWSEGQWPIQVGDKTLGECCQTCATTKGCTSFHLAKPKGSAATRLCHLFGHSDVSPAEALGGDCYILPGLNDPKGRNDEQDDEDDEEDGPSEEDCKKFVNKGCPSSSSGKSSKTPPAKKNPKSPKKDGNDMIEEKIQENEAKKKETAKETKRQQQKPLKAGKVDGDQKKAVAPKGASTNPKSVNSKEQPKQKEVTNSKTTNEGKTTQKSGKETQSEPKIAKKEQNAVKNEVDPKGNKKASKESNSKKSSNPTEKPKKPKKVKKPKIKLPKAEIKSVPDVHKIRKVKPPHTYNGKHLIGLGQGGCRGEDWNEAPWPKFLGRQTLHRCASKCSQDPDCTAIHVLRKAGKTYECLHFDVDHDKIMVVRGLGGHCYKLDNEVPEEEDDVEPDPNPPEEEEDSIDVDGDEIIPITGPVQLVHLGRGLCRGKGWSNKIWPIIMAPTTQIDCANKCAMRKGCTAFDISKKKKSRFHCMLYGHVHVTPASGVPGECFTLKSRLEKALGRIVEVDQVEEQEEIAKSKSKGGGGPYPFRHLGKGMCRGTDWTTKKWPKLRGRRTLQGCADACGNNGDCTAFDVSEKEGDDFNCILYGHTYVRPASGVPGNCFKLGHEKKAQTENNKGKTNAKEAKKSSIRTASSKVKDTHSRKNAEGKPDSSKATKQASASAYELLGKGLCRGPKWQGRYWPKATEAHSLAECAAACSSVNGCTAFDISPTPDKEQVCFLFGHKDVKPASGLKGQCYKMISVNHDKYKLSKKKSRGDNLPPRKAEGVISLLGKGACRGSGWQEGRWPILKGPQSVDSCGKVCLATQGCTGFHAAPASGKNIDCIVFGHKSIIPASGVPGDCYIVTIKDDSSSLKPASKNTKANATKKNATKNPKKSTKMNPPKIVANENESEDDEEWLIELPPPEVRSRDHIDTILGLDTNNNEGLYTKIEDTLKQLKKVYEHSIKPLETTYKYRELSNRHFGDPEIFNKPLVVLMGPWSGGKSTMINYLLDTEFTKNAFKATAEPSKGFHFNIAMHGSQEEEVEGTELAAEWTFSSLQKFGQEFLKKLKGRKMPSKLLEMATFAEIPGVLETGSKKRIERNYSFNDACQWFIDHADLILLVYDYAKLDIGPETEALLDQLKGREGQVRIILNKADEITAEELLKIQSSLVWNVSPLMASVEPPIMYAGSFWSRPYKSGAPKKLLRAQENALLSDIREAIDKRVENRIATARRFAVRVRNHAKMVDCYLTNYYNQKGLFSNQEAIAQSIINHPEKFHIYEGISSMTNISRYDLPDPETYRVFFNLHSLYNFPTLQSTCTFFKGCPINKLDTAIAYELPELLTAYKRQASSTSNGRNHA